MTTMWSTIGREALLVICDGNRLALSPAVMEIEQDQLFEQGRAVVTYPAKAEILGYVVQSRARDGVVNEIEGTTCPAPWLQVKIDDVGVERVNDGCGNELVCRPHPIARRRQRLERNRD